ncbi:MAG: DUF4968 domain-containing protein [bacterium]|nr:DUF4968 domain-containing protein [bacterium]
MSIRSFGRGWSVGVLLVLASSAEAGWQHLGPVTSWSVEESVLTVQCGPSAVRVEAVNEHVVRVRLAPDGRFSRDFSWAMVRQPSKGTLRQVQESADALRTSTGGLEIVAHRDPCRLEIRDADGRVLVADDPARGMGWQPQEGDAASQGGAVRAWQQWPDGARVYGLGEKTGSLNKNGRAWTMWNSDTPCYGGSTDPLYKSIPFFIVARDGRYHGVFFDNPWRSTFDFGQLERELLSFGAEGGELNYYVIAGPSPKDVVRRYTGLTGRIELPPKWALGYHQCRYSYYPAARVRQIAKTFRDKRIPCDALYFDIDYMDGFRCFTWDRDKFPDPKGLMDDLHGLGFHTVAIIDPGIKHDPGYSVYDSGTEQGVWLTKPNGEVYVGQVWPGPSVFPDFTRAEVRTWWAQLYPPFLRSSGLDGIWNDMNEPSNFVGPNGTVPLDLRHDNAGEPESHRAVHNVYGMQMSRATMVGLKRTDARRRAFVLTRATYAGGQRYAAGWTGDNLSTWDHLRMSIAMTLNLGVSGMPFVGPDIGGFVGGPAPELFARWIQVGALFPFCRTHCGWPSPDQEPWAFGPQVEDIARTALELRYELMPHLYTLFEESHRTGLPIMRPLWMEFPDMHRWYEDQVFMLGADMYVVPIVRPGARDFFHPLPPGVWYDVRTGLIHGGGQDVRIPANLENLPRFVRGGAIIPTQTPVQSTTETPQEPLILDVWPLGESEGWLYEDDGESMAYARDGIYRRTRFECKADGRVVALTMHAPEGSYMPPERTPLVRLHGLSSSIAALIVNVDNRGGRVGPGTAGFLSDSPLPTAPGEYVYDEASGAWLVRMHPDGGRAQVLVVGLEAPQANTTPISFDFSAAGNGIAHHGEILPPRYEDGVARFRVQSTWGPYIVLPRMSMSADAHPIMKIRLATEHTAKLGVRFATQEDPTLSDRSETIFDVTADGEMHDYTFDLSEVSAGKWTGTVYWVRIDFKDGVRAAELVTLDQVSFEPPRS